MVETVEGVEATAKTLTLPVRRRRRAARGGERQSVTSLRRSAILEAIGEPRGPPPRSRAPPPLLLLLLVAERLGCGWWWWRARAEQTAVREMGCPACDLHLRFWPFGFCRRLGLDATRQGPRIYVPFDPWNDRFAPAISLSSSSLFYFAAPCHFSLSSLVKLFFSFTKVAIG